MDWLFFLRRKRTRVLTEYVRLNVIMQVVEVRKTGKEPELSLRFTHSGRDQKVFAEIRYSDVPKVGALFSDAERWVGNVLAKANLK